MHAHTIVRGCDAIDADQRDALEESLLDPVGKGYLQPCLLHVVLAYRQAQGVFPLGGESVRCGTSIASFV